LIAKFLEVTPPTWADPKPSETPTQEVPVIPDVIDGNTVSALQEYCQARGIAALPSYEATRVGGPDHAPLFTMTVRLLDKEATSDPFAAKKAAKKQAAARLLQAMR